MPKSVRSRSSPSKTPTTQKEECLKAAWNKATKEMETKYGSVTNVPVIEYWNLINQYKSECSRKSEGGKSKKQTKSKKQRKTRRR